MKHPRAGLRIAVAPVALVALCITFATISAAEEKQSPKSKSAAASGAELARLHFFLGSWKREMTQTELRGKTVTVTSTEEWDQTPGGNFLRHSAEWKNSEGKSGGQTTMACYDPDRKKYRFFQFDSDGTAIQMTGGFENGKLVLEIEPLVGAQGMLRARMTLVEKSKDELTGMLELCKKDGNYLTVSQWTDRRAK